jgi:hypothetical protein
MSRKDLSNVLKKGVAYPSTRSSISIVMPQLIPCPDRINAQLKVVIRVSRSDLSFEGTNRFTPD